MQQDPRPKKRVTITDVARHAGVSTAAVSKVLRNAYGVSAAMREKVGAAIAELNYRPHAAARGMRGRTYTIGVLLDNIRNTFFADILDGVRDTLQDSEYTVMVGAAGFGAEAQSKTTRAMVDRQMDGLILIAPGSPRAEVLATAPDRAPPLPQHADARPRPGPGHHRAVLRRTGRPVLPDGPARVAPRGAAASEGRRRTAARRPLSSRGGPGPDRGQLCSTPVPSSPKSRTPTAIR